MRKPYQTLLLDLDGTLVDSRADLASAVNHTLAHLGHPPQTIEEIVPRIGNGLRRLLIDSIGLMDVDVLVQAKNVFEDYYAHHCLDQTVLYEGVRDGLAHFTNKLKLGVVTNKPHAFAIKILAHLDLLKIFGVVIGGDSLPKGKPDPEPLHEALRVLKAEASTALIVGDGIQDVQAGQAAGVRTCLVRYGFGFNEGLMKLGPDHAIHRFIELKEIVK